MQCKLTHDWRGKTHKALPDAHKITQKYGLWNGQRMWCCDIVRGAANPQYSCILSAWSHTTILCAMDLTIRY